MALEHLSPAENGHTHSSTCGHLATEGSVDPNDPLSAASLLALTDAHIAQMVKNIAESQIVKDAWANGQQLSVHGWCYHVASAKLRDLDIGWRGVGEPAVSLGSAVGSEYDTISEA
jgi:carbonic anhydrase